MFSALKKLVSTSENANTTQTPPGMQTMAQSLQKKFAKGIQYNMKIIIKGDRNVGKSSLFYRLQGQKFKEEYIPTQEIQVACIQWNYKATDDVVKVEVWDVVDKGKKKIKMEGLKMENGANATEVVEEAALDAEFVDVYKGTNGVILMLDITKSWTFDYVQRELLKISENIPVLILANHRDMGHHRVVNDDDVKYFIEQSQRPKGSGQILYAEASMRNGFGLKFLHKFFNLPFLQLQHETLLRQLETNARESELTLQELEMLQESDEQNYDLFLEAITHRRRQVAEQLSQIPPTSPPNPNQPNVLPQSQSSHTNFTTPPAPQAPPARSISVPSTPSQIELPQLPPTTTQSQEQKQGIMARLFGKNNNAKEEKTIPVTSTPPSKPSSTTQSPLSVPSPIALSSKQKTSVEEFVPDDSLDTFFLDDEKNNKSDDLPVSTLSSESDDEGDGNPMVASFQDYDEPQFVEQSNPGLPLSPRQDLSSDEEEEEIKPVVETKQPINSLSESSLPKPNIELTPQTDAKSEPKSDDNVVSTYVHQLEFEDLSVLEKSLKNSTAKFDSRKQSLSSGDNNDSIEETIKRRSSKDKNKDESKSKKKHRKHKDEKKKKSKKKSDKDLEEFLSGVSNEPKGGEDYETI